MPRYDYTLAEVNALVEFHMKDQEDRATVWDQAVLSYNAKLRDGISGEAYETGDALSSTLVPRSPQLKITPKREDLSEAADAQEGLITETFNQADAEGVMRKAVTLAALQDYAVIKTVWKDRKRRPHFRAIAAKNVFFDPSAEDWDEIAYVGEITVKSLAEIRGRTKRKSGPKYSKKVYSRIEHAPGDVPGWLKTSNLTEQSAHSLMSALKQHVVVELIMFDRVGDKPPRLLHIIPGQDEPLLDIRFPHRYLDNPFSLLTLEVPLEGLCGASPYQLVKNLGSALNQMYSLRMATARAAIPTAIVNKGALQNADTFLTALREADHPDDVVEIEMQTNVPVSDVVMFTQTPGNVIDFHRAIDSLEQLIQTTLGLPSYLRAGNSGADFATEIQLQSHELANRAGARRKLINGVLVDMGVKALQLYSENLDHEDKVYARAAEGEKPAEIDREIAALHLFAARAGETPLEMDYTVRVVDEATENPVVRLQALQPYLPLLLQLAQANMVQAPPIVMQLLRWLGLEKAIPDNPEAMQVQQLAAAQAGREADVPGVSGAQAPGASGDGSAAKMAASNAPQMPEAAGLG
jgi:hypothetical protein